MVGVNTVNLLEAAFLMVSAVSAAIAVRDTRASRDDEWRDRWRRESEARLDGLADAIVAVGIAAITWREKNGYNAEFEAAQLRLRRAVTDALNPWIELEAIFAVADEPASAVTTQLVEHALLDVANAIDRVRDEARKTWRQRRRELKRAR